MTKHDDKYVGKSGYSMNIGFKDLSKEQQRDLIARAKDIGYSKEEIIEAFNEEAGDSDNALDFVDNSEFLEDMLRRDRQLLEDYLDYIIDTLT